MHLTTAWMVVKEVDLEMEGEGDDDVDGASDSNDDSSHVEIEFVGPYVVDLLTSTTNPVLPSLLIEAGQYDDIEVEIEKLEPEDLDSEGNPLIDTYPELDRFTLYLEGTYTSQDGTHNAIPFKLQSELSEEFDLAGSDISNTITLNTDQTVDLIVAFRMARWFRFDDIETNSDLDLTLQEAIVWNEAEQRHELFLSGDNRSDVMEVIEDNIEESGDFGEDDDDDGELGSDEDEDDDDEWDDDEDDQ
ncbi:hypothetical protein [Saccharospirillum salsuginis]|uniref:hypothetical protein n=1 Tax=Saccharospirillum salsuginis TaxID=418750 RepID=UPI00167C18AF|nr:hypothetical protein [Saccharospirillum salsuginis]